MAVAAHTQSGVDIAVVAREHGAGGDNAFLQENQALTGLEGRAGRISSHDGAVIQRLEPVVDQVAVVLAALLSHEQCGIVAGTGNQCQDFARLGLDADDGAHFALHEHFSVSLQTDVDAQFQIVACYRRDVIGTVVVMALDFTCRVADEDFFTLDTTQPGLVAFLDAQVARVIPGTVVVVILDVAGVDLADVAQHVGSDRVVVLSEDALHDIEAGETVQFLLQSPVILGCEVVHEHLLGECRETASFSHFLPAMVKLLAGDAHRVAEVHRVKRRHILGNDYQVVFGHIIDDQRVVAVIDEPSRRIDDLLHEGVVVGVGLIGAVKHL